MKQKNPDKYLERLGKTLLKPIEPFQGSPRLQNVYGSAPVETYDKLIFLDKDKEKEWEEMDEATKTSCLNHLKETCSQMENKLAIELLCHVINDLSKRLKKLEKDK